MLDPFTALSLAGNVVQFVELGCNLAAKAHDVYTSPSGASKESLEMEAVTTRLLGTVHDLDEHLNALDRTTTPESVSVSTQRLIEIANACRLIAKDILRRLEALKVRDPSSVWCSVRQAFKTIWSKDELDALMKRLKSYVSELDSAILVSLKRNIDLEGLRASQSFYKLDQATQHIVDLLLLNRSVFTTALRDHTKEIKCAIVNEQAQTRAMILELVQQQGTGQAISSSFIQSAEGDKPPSYYEGTKTEKKGVREEAGIASRILDSLGFPAMHTRQDEVAQAYHATFGWIFDEPTPGSNDLPWDNYVKWLRQGEQRLYWINGKAGSGKSTLMKYIFNHKTTSYELSRWSNSMPLLVATFFFWNGGTAEQRSQFGLLRSLLYQILQYRPVLIPLLFPEEHASLKTMAAEYALLMVQAEDYHEKGRTEESVELKNQAYSRLSQHPKQSWSLSRLQAAFRRLLSLGDLPLKLCFFIDGLDEFEGNQDCDDRQYIIELLKSLASSPYIKVCMSSRPLVMFEESFKRTPGLRLQDLTSGDIRRYVVDKISIDSRMRSIADSEPSQKHDFVKEICNKAQGVFLWVKLVVRSLLDGLNNSDHLADLRARLDILPTDLEDLYRHMLGNIDKLYQARTSQIFQMVQTMRSIQGHHRNEKQRTTPVTLLLLALAIEDKPDVDVNTVSEAWLRQNLSSLCDAMRQRLQIWCAGLLEVPDFLWNRVDALDADATVRTKITWEVAFLHRTARDFIESEGVWQTLLKDTAGTGFDPSASLLESTVLLYQLAGRLVNNPLGHGLFEHELLEPATQALFLAQRAKAETANSYFLLLNELDLVMGQHLVRWTGSYRGHWSQYLRVGINFTSFVDLTVFYGLHRYVRAWVLATQAVHPEDPKLSSSLFKPEIPDPEKPIRTVTLLDMAVSQTNPSPETAEILLNYGADPNERTGYEPLPIWEYVLSRAKNAGKRRADEDRWLQIMSIFMHYHVDLRGVQSDRKVAYLRIIDVLEASKEAYPEEVASLQKAVNKKLRSRRNQLKVWAGEKLSSSKTSPHPLRL